jgi:hypothetical protein
VEAEATALAAAILKNNLLGRGDASAEVSTSGLQRRRLDVPNCLTGASASMIAIIRTVPKMRREREL